MWQRLCSSSPLRGRPSFRLYCSVPRNWGEGFAEKFAHLKNDQLSRHVGKLVSVPPLYHHRKLAKGVTAESCNSFLLTEERLALWTEMYKANGRFSSRQPLDGFCLSGPNGVGKSNVLHMLVAIAQVNGWITLYIVSFLHSLPHFLP